MLMLIVSLLLTIVGPYIGTHVPSVTIKKLHTLRNSERSRRPNVVENGSDFVSLPLSTPIGAASNLAFTPDGTSYFIGSTFGSVGDVLHRVSPTGQETTFPDLHAAGNVILYARGNLWTTANAGIVKINPDGTGHHWYALGIGKETALAQSIVYGSDGSIYTDVGYYTSYGLVTSNWLYRIDIHDVITKVQIPINAAHTMTSDPSGNFYIAYDDYYGASGTEGVLRFRFDGTTKLFPIGTFANQINSLAFTRGSLYFISRIGSGVFYLNRLAPGDVLTRISLPLNWFPGNLAVDFGGNIWVTNGSYSGALDGYELYQYDTYAGRLRGPYEPGLVNSVYGGIISVGPDDNIWFAATKYSTSFNDIVGIGVFVRHVQTLEPAVTNASIGKTATFSILETHFNGPWTAQSSAPAVATVMTMSSSGMFSVTGVTRGSAQIIVRDRLGNESYEAVIVQ